MKTIRMMLLALAAVVSHGAGAHSDAEMAAEWATACESPTNIESCQVISYDGEYPARIRVTADPQGRDARDVVISGGWDHPEPRNAFNCYKDGVNSRHKEHGGSCIFQVQGVDVSSGKPRSVSGSSALGNINQSMRISEHLGFDFRFALIHRIFEGHSVTPPLAREHSHIITHTHYSLSTPDAPDLRVGNVVPWAVNGGSWTKNDRLETGAPLALGTFVRNHGGALAAGTSLRFHQSADANITTADAVVGQVAVGMLAALRSTGTVFAYLTAPAQAGTYHYGACVVPVAGETDTGNNCSAGVRVTVRGESCTGGKVLVNDACACPTGQEEVDGVCRTPTPPEPEVFHTWVVPAFPSPTGPPLGVLRVTNGSATETRIELAGHDEEGRAAFHAPKVLGGSQTWRIRSDELGELLFDDPARWWTLKLTTAGSIYVTAFLIDATDGRITRLPVVAPPPADQ